MIASRRFVRGGLVVCAAVALAGCGGDTDDDTPSVQDWGSQVAPAAADASGMGRDEPEVRAVRFEPAEAIPDRPLEVTVEASVDATGIEYSWRAEGRRVAAEGPRVIVPGDLVRGDSIEVEITITAGGRVSEPETASVRVANRTPRIEELGIQVVEGDGEDLGFWVAGPVATDPDEDEVEFRYEWRVAGRGVVSEEDRLTRDGWERGAEVQLVVWASDGEGEGLPLEAAPFEVGNSPPDIVSRPPGLDGSGRFVYRVEARDRDGDRGLRYSLAQGPSSMWIDPFSGEVTWQATVADAGEHLVEIEVDDRRGGATRQSFFVRVDVESSPAAAAN